MSFWSEDFNYKDYNNTDFDFKRNLKEEFNEFIERSFLEIYESLKPENPVKSFNYKLAIDFKKLFSDKYYNPEETINFSDDYAKITISKNEQEDINIGIFNSKMRNFLFSLKAIAEKIVILTQEDFSMELDLSAEEFINKCNKLKEKYEILNDGFYFESFSSEKMFASFFNNFHINRVNCFCNLVSKYGDNVYVFIKKDKEGNIAEAEIMPQQFEEHIKNEFSFKNSFLMSHFISSDSEYISQEEFNRLCKDNPLLNTHYYNSINQAKSEFQKNQILKNLETINQEAPLIPRRL